MNLRIMTLTCIAVLMMSSTSFASVYASTIDWDAGTGTSTARSYTENALGSYSASPYISGSTIDFLSLGMGGSAILDFGQSFTGDITIWETTYNRPNTYNEYAEVWASTDGSEGSWVNLTALSGPLYNQNVDSTGAQIISTGSGIFNFLMILDVTGDIAGGTRGDGFDINAVSVNPTPIPGAVWLLGSGLVGLIGIRRKRIIN